VTFVDWDGTVLRTQTVPYGGDATAPSNPVRDGWMFTGWDIGYTNVTRNLIVTAQYVEFVVVGGTNDPIEPPPPPPTSGPVPPVPPEPGQPVEVSILDQAEVLSGSGSPEVYITDDSVPKIAGIDLWGVEGMRHLVWALLNLILSIAGAVMMVIMVFRVILRRKHDREDEDELESRRNAAYGGHGGLGRLDGDGGLDGDGESEPDDERQRRHGRLVLITAIPLLAVLDAVLFLFTENIRLTMVFMDVWTLAHGIIFVATLLCFVFAFRRKRVEEVEDDHEIEVKDAHTHLA